MDHDGQVILWGDKKDDEGAQISAWLVPHSDGIRIGFMRYFGLQEVKVGPDGKEYHRYKAEEYVLPLSRVMQVLEDNIDVQAECLLEA